MDEQMDTPDEPRILELADLPMDAADEALVAELAALFEAADPVPDGLSERLQFVLALDEVFTEVAELTRMPVDAMAVRGETAMTRTETMSFAAESLTAMITVTHVEPDCVRVDGWIAPPMALEVRLRTQTDRMAAEVDESGRFSFESVPTGLAQLSFHGVEENGPAVVTPMFEL